MINDTDLPADIDYQQVIESTKNIVLKEKRYQNKLNAEQVRESIDSQAILERMLSLIDDVKNTPDESKLLAITSARFEFEILNTVLKKALPDIRPIEVKDGKKSSTLILKLE
jgi:hypothetical protein